MPFAADAYPGLVGMGNLQHRTRMLLLPPGLLATVRPQGFGGRFLEGGIRGRWFAGVVAILGQARFQFR